MMKRLLGMLLAVGLLVVAASGVRGQETKPAEGKADTLEKQAAAIKAVDPSLVVVEYTLQYDKGEAPSGGDRRSGNLAEVIRDERPYEVAGVLVDEKHVVSSDIYLHPRFIKSIAVRKPGKDGGVVDAKISAFGKQRAGLLLELAGALKGATPLKIDEAAAGPYSVVSYLQSNGVWGSTVSPLTPTLNVFDGRKTTGASQGVAVDKNGVAVGVIVDDELPADNSWKGSPLKWAAYSADEMKKMLDGFDKQAEKTIVRVTLNFRSPKASDRASSFRGRGDNDPNATVQQVLGVVLDAKTILVLVELKPNITARLERIRVFTDPPVDAKFKASLTDYGAFLAETDTPFAAVEPISKKTSIELRGDALPMAEIILQGEKRVSYVEHSRVTGDSMGWQKNLYPDVINSSRSAFLADADGALFAMPVNRREKAAVEERYSYGNNLMMTTLAQVMAAIADLKKNGDPANVPLTEDEENRVAWVGVELQPLNQDLARANNVSDLTNDGETGGLVAFVYPDSPAGKAGVEPGWVLLRIEAEGQPKPIDVKVENDMYHDRPFPWDRLDQWSEQYFDQVPPPWQPAETPLTRTLTDLGFGKKYTAEFFHDGKSVKKDFTIVQGPPNFLTAPKFKNAALGLTVRDMSYEVRRYLQKKPDDGGVVISKIELGSKASLAGLKPYEQITAVNDKEVKTVQDFEKLTKGQEELRLSVMRKTTGRIVKIKLNGPAAETAPADDKAPDDSK